MDIKEISISQLHEYENNPRNNDGAVDAVAASIEEFGFKVPIIIDSENIIVAGHTRLKAAKKLGLDTVPCIVADDLTPEQIKAFRLADNKTGELAGWDFEKLELEMAELSNFDMSAFGFDMEEFETGISDDVFEESIKSLSDRFIVPPFSILDTRQGYWQERKDAWKQIIKSGNGRDDDLIGSGLKDLAEMKGANLSGKVFSIPSFVRFYTIGFARQAVR